MTGVTGSRIFGSVLLLVGGIDAIPGGTGRLDPKARDPLSIEGIEGIEPESRSRVRLGDQREHAVPILGKVSRPDVLVARQQR